MISKKYFRIKKNGEPTSKCYCRNPELIENYDLAIADKTQTWEVHHRREEFHSYKELIERGEYYNVSPEDLIFLTPAEHRKIDSYCKRNSEARKGRKRAPLSEEHKRKLSEAQINRKDHSKKALCVETGEVFDSTKEAERQTEINNHHIADVCRGERKTTGGYHWRYV